jgi:hypothetical protein
MLVLLTLLTIGYFAVVLRVARGRPQAAGPAAKASPAPALPVDDRPPPSAVGWPPGGNQFVTYVNEGFAALDAYLSEGFTA